MSLTPVRRVWVAAVLVVAGAVSVQGDEPLNWGQKMFEVQKHDFGVVARGADVRYRIKVKNLYKETVHFSNVRTTALVRGSKARARTTPFWASITSSTRTKVLTFSISNAFVTFRSLIS